MKNLAAIKQYFDDGGPHARPVSIDELKKLDKDEKNELGAMCCDALGETHEPS